MNIKELKEIIKDLPDDMKIEIITSDDYVDNVWCEESNFGCCRNNKILLFSEKE